MYCPFCNHIETKVIDSRLAGEGRHVVAALLVEVPG